RPRRRCSFRGSARFPEGSARSPLLLRGGGRVEELDREDGMELEPVAGGARLPVGVIEETDSDDPDEPAVRSPFPNRPASSSPALRETGWSSLPFGRDLHDHPGCGSFGSCNRALKAPAG